MIRQLIEKHEAAPNQGKPYNDEIIFQRDFTLKVHFLKIRLLMEGGGGW